MAVRTIETRLKITGEDHASKTFDLVAQKMRNLEQTAVSVNRRMDSVARGMSSATWRRQAEFQAGIVQKMSSIAPVAAGAGLGAKIRGISARAAGVRDSVSEFASYALPGAAGSMLGMGGAAVGGLAVGGAAAYGLHEAVSFEKAMNEVQKKVDIPAGESLSTIEKLINRNARAYGIAREEMAGLAAQAGQSGIEFKDLAGFMELAAKAAAAWDMSARDASERLAKIKAQTQWTIPELKEWGDQVNELGDKSAAAERDIVEMFGRSAAAAKAAGVPFKATQAFLTSLSGVGMQEDVAARFFNSFTSTLRTAKKPKKGPDPYAPIGLSAAGVAKGMKTDATNTILEVLGRLEKHPDKAAVAQSLFGKEWWDEAARAGQALPEIIKNLKLINSGSWNGSLDRNMTTTLSTTENHLKRFGALTSEIGDRLTRWALPTINDQLERTLKAFDAAEKTGFLTGPDGKPIDRVADKTPVPFGAANRARFLNGPEPFSTPLVPTMPSVPSWLSSAGSAIADSPANVWGNWQKLGMQADRFDAQKGAPAAAAAFGVSGARSGLLGFGLGGAQNPIAAIAKLEGAANISLTIRVEAERDSIVRDVVQEMRASGALRTRDDVGTTMAR